MHRLRDGRPPGCDHLPKDIFADPFFANLESSVECIHCESVFKLGDAVWVEGLWSCPYHLECGGSLIDFVPARRERRRTWWLPLILHGGAFGQAVKTDAA